MNCFHKYFFNGLIYISSGACKTDMVQEISTCTDPSMTLWEQNTLIGSFDTSKCLTIIESEGRKLSACRDFTIPVDLKLHGLHLRARRLCVNGKVTGKSIFHHYQFSSNDKSIYCFIIFPK